MENFFYSIPTEIYFGRGQVSMTGQALKSSGATRVLVCYGSDRIRETGLLDRIISQMEAEGIAFSLLNGIRSNPRIETARRGIEICRKEKCDFILAVGGGSVIDCSKAIAAGYYYDGDPWDFFTRQAKIWQALPVGTVLTLAATGSEMNGYAVLNNEETCEKLSGGSPLLRPVFSVLDPELTFTVPPFHTAAGIADIMAHVFEQYFTPVEGTYLNDRMCEAVLKTCVHYGPRVITHPDDYEARANLMWAGTLALNDLLSMGTDGGDWAVHMIEHELSAIYDISHGAGLAVLYPSWMEYVMDDATLPRFAGLANHMWNIPEGDHPTIGRRAIKALREFFLLLGLPSRLSEMGVEEKRIDEMAAKAVAWGDLGTFRTLDENDIRKILRMAL